MIILVTVVVLTIFISSQCSLYEAILYSTRIGALEAEKVKGKRKEKAVQMLEMKKNISVPLSAILILNTIANTAGATIAGMYAHKVIGQVWVPLFSVGFTLGILFFAEIIPKTLGAVYWRPMWHLIVFPLTVIKYALYPFIIITHKFSDALTRKGTTAPITEEDILGMIRLGAKDGGITQWESLLLHNIINLESQQVQEIMTPRTVMYTLDETMTVEEAYEIANEQGFTRIPIYREDKENIVGYVVKHDLSSAKVLSQPNQQLSSIGKPISFVPETENCLTLLTDFLKKRRHIAVIVDEFGGIAGLVTLEDLLETVLGTEIVDETDSIVDLQKHARKRRLKWFETQKGLEERLEIVKEARDEIGDQLDTVDSVTEKLEAVQDAIETYKTDGAARREIKMPLKPDNRQPDYDKPGKQETGRLDSEPLDAVNKENEAVKMSREETQKPDDEKYAVSKILEKDGHNKQKE